MLNILGAIAITLLFLAISWSCCRLAAATQQKKEFLASSLCCVGSGVIAVFFLMLALLPVDQYGTTHEPDWTDILVRLGFAALVAGHLVKCWRTPFFLWTVAALVLNFMEMEVNTHAFLPKLAQSVIHYAALITYVISTRVWTDALKSLKGNWFSIKCSHDFER